jgi:hypothetical protein
MIDELKQFLLFMRPAFSRRATYVWFVIVFVGFLIRTDTFGVSSIIRALTLAPEHYPSLLHFFHSSAWNVQGLLALWWAWLGQHQIAYRVGGRIVLVGDHTKAPKDGRKMPAVTTLHQNSETASKPSFFRGHHWGCIALVVKACDKYFATPLWANIQEGLEMVNRSKQAPSPMTTWTVAMAQHVASAMNRRAYLVLDAYFAVGPVFLLAAQVHHGVQHAVHIVTRAKKNIVAYVPATPNKKRKRGRPKIYGKKLKLAQVFDSKAKSYQFQTGQAMVYERREKVKYLVLDLLWKPVKGMLRFVLVETSRGRMILITSDLSLDPLVVLELYCRRTTVETMFNTLKHTLGAMAYHFWSRYLSPASRRPKKRQSQKQRTSCPRKTQNTLSAIEKFVNLQLLVLGMLQLIAKKYPVQVKRAACCWLRTVSSSTPSEFITRMALTQVLTSNLWGFGKDWIVQLIREKQEKRRTGKAYRMAG